MMQKLSSSGALWGQSPRNYRRQNQGKFSGGCIGNIGCPKNEHILGLCSLKVSRCLLHPGPMALVVCCSLMFDGNFPEKMYIAKTIKNSHEVAIYLRSKFRVSPESFGRNLGSAWARWCYLVITWCHFGLTWGYFGKHVVRVSWNFLRFEHFLVIRKIEQLLGIYKDNPS